MQVIDRYKDYQQSFEECKAELQKLPPEHPCYSFRNSKVSRPGKVSKTRAANHFNRVALKVLYQIPHVISLS